MTGWIVWALSIVLLAVVIPEEIRQDREILEDLDERLEGLTRREREGL